MLATGVLAKDAAQGAQCAPLPGPWHLDAARYPGLDVGDPVRAVLFSIQEFASLSA